MRYNEDTDIVTEIPDIESIKKFKKMNKQATLNRKGWFKVQYNDQDERRPDIDIIPYFFFHPIERYDKKFNQTQVKSQHSKKSQSTVKQQPIIEQEKKKKLPKLPPLQYLTEDEQNIIFQKRNVTIVSGRKAHMVKVGKIFLIAIIVTTKGFGFSIIKEYFFERCKNIKMCRKEYKAIIQRIITTAWKKLERVIRKYCKYNITPFTNEQIRLLFAPIENMKQKLNPDCRSTLTKYLKLCFHIERVVISKQQSVALYKAIRKMVHSDPIYIQMKERQNQKQDSSGMWPRCGSRRGRKKQNMFHKTYILRHLQHEIDNREYNQLLEECAEDVKNNELEQMKIASGRYSYDQIEFKTKTIQQKEIKLKIMKQVQLIASALYYKGWGRNFYIEYIQEVTQDPDPQLLEIDQSTYNKYSKIVMRKLFQKLQSEITKQKRKIVQFTGDEEKQIIGILLNYKMTLDLRARFILQNYLVKIFTIDLQEGFMVEQISDVEALFLYKTILQEVNAKSSLSYLQQNTNKDKTSKFPRQSPSAFPLSDVFTPTDHHNRKQQYKRQINEQNQFISQKGLTLGQYENNLIDLYLDQKETKKVIKYMNARYPKGQEFSPEMIVNKLSELLYRGVLRAEMQRSKYTNNEIPEMTIPTEEQCKMMMLSPNGYMVLKNNVFIHILKEEHFDMNNLYFVVSAVNDGYEKLKIEIGKSDKQSKRKKHQDEVDEANKKNQEKEKKKKHKHDKDLSIKQCKSEKSRAKQEHSCKDEASSYQLPDLENYQSNPQQENQYYDDNDN